MPKSFTTQIEEDGEVINVELDRQFIAFYKKETGHSTVTKQGVAKFVKRLIEVYQKGIKEYLI